MPAGGRCYTIGSKHSKAEYSLIEYGNGAAKEWHGEAIRWRDRLLEVGDKNQESKKICRRNSGEEKEENWRSIALSGKKYQILKDAYGCGYA